MDTKRIHQAIVARRKTIAAGTTNVEGKKIVSAELRGDIEDTLKRAGILNRAGNVRKLPISS